MTMIERLKAIRPEFKIAGAIALSIILYGIISFLSSLLTDGKHTPDSTKEFTSQKGSINEAVNSERPIVISSEGMKQEFNNLMELSPEIKGMEVATETSTPTIWVYMNNNGNRRDDIAEAYCTALHSRGVMAKRVTILDERARTKGQLVEIGDKQCNSK